MDMNIGQVAAITVLCYLVGLLVQATPLNNKWIPIICGGAGGGLGVLGYFVMPGFPAGDLLTALAVGVISGLAATGVHQIGKQLGEKEE